MNLESWSAIMGRIVAGEPETIDPPGEGAAEGRDLFPAVAAVPMPDAAMVRPDAVAVGFRVAEPLPDLVDRAFRLAAFALERDVEVVILSHLDECGFERFGFRVERIAGSDAAARAACEAQIRRFWNIDLVL